MDVIFIFDTGPFVAMRSCDPKISSEPWPKMNDAINQGWITSVAEVKAELEQYGGNQEELIKWLKNNKDIFTDPSEEEQQIVAKILSTEAGRSLIATKKLYEKKHVADPFVIAKAIHTINQSKGKLIPEEGVVVTNETRKSKDKQHKGIPDVCDEFNVKSTHTQDFAQDKGWDLD